MRGRVHAAKASAPAPPQRPSPSLRPVAHDILSAGWLQRACACGGTPGQDGECAECKKKRLQRQAAAGAPPEAPPIVHDVLRSPGQPLDPATRTFMERRFARFDRIARVAPAAQAKLVIGEAGDVFERQADAVSRGVTDAPEATRSTYDFSRVRIHADGEASESTHAVNALAYTVGNRIVFGAGRYAPETETGRRLLAHELVHVVQQTGSGTPTLQRQQVCSPAPCPPDAEAIPAMPPIPTAAEKCIQGEYARTHPASKPGVTLAFNLGWMTLTSQASHHRTALACLTGGKPTRKDVNFTAKSGVYAGEPDIWDFNNQTMYEITTWSQMWKVGKLAAQIALANDITSNMDCGNMVWSPGDWVPSPCLALPNGLFLQVANTGGVLFYTPLKVGTKELEWRFIFELLGSAAAVALAKKLLEAAAKAGAKAGAKGAAGVAGVVYGIVSLITAAALIGCGKGKLNLSEGEEPIVALYKMMAANGTPIPPELQKMVEEDPALKARIDKALSTSGDPTAEQKALNEEILKLLNDNKDQFTKEELDTILAATAVTGGSLPKGSVTIQTVKQMAQQQGGGGTGKPTNVWEKAKEGGGTAAPEKNVWQKAAETGGAAIDLQNKYPGIGEAQKNALSGASAPVRKLFDAFVSGKTGPELTTEFVSRFLATVPKNLTDAQADAAIARLKPWAGQTIDEIIAALKKALDQSIPQPKPPDTGGAGTGVVTKAAPAPNPPTGVPGTGATTKPPKKSELSMFDNEVFALIAPGRTAMLSPADKKINEEVDAFILGVTTDGRRYVGAARVQLLSISADGNKQRMKVLKSNALVDRDGNIVFAAGVWVGEENWDK